MQEDHFYEELQTLQDPKGTLKRNNSICKLDPFIAQDGLIQIGGCLNRADLDFGVKHPVILPRCNHITEHIIWHHYKRTGCQGWGITVSELCFNEFWIVGCTAAVSSMVYKCMNCHHLQREYQMQKMVDLPEEKTGSTPPFHFSSFDCFSPFIVKEGHKELKKSMWRC